MKSTKIVSLSLLTLVAMAACGERKSTEPVAQPVHFSADPRAPYEKFLAALAAEPGAVRTESGLVYRELVPGGGPPAREHDTVTLRFQTKTLDGRVYEDSAAYGGRVHVALDAIEPCEREAVLRMKVGGTSRFACPAAADRATPRSPVAVEATLVAVGEPLPPPGH